MYGDFRYANVQTRSYSRGDTKARIGIEFSVGAKQRDAFDSSVKQKGKVDLIKVEINNYDGK